MSSSVARTRPEAWRERGYKNGSILRIKMVNFLTYDECEAFPGPKLNVVIGPNGTGKSSISAAICLALCGDPKLIGRSDDLSTFVNSKSNRDDAFIEVDLLRQDSITTIRRSFAKSKSKKGRRSNTSQFYVDGEPMKLQEVQELVKSLNINFDNLISYMPQDRVGEFTTLDSKKLLSETLRAVENPDGDGLTMKDEMDQLIHLQNEQMQEAGHERTIQRNIEQLRSELTVMQPSVDRMREREEVKRKIRLYEIKLEYLRFQHRKEELKEEKEGLQALQIEMNAIEARLDEVRGEHREAEVRLKRVGQAQKQAQRQSGARSEEATVAASKCEDYNRKRTTAVTELNRILTEKQRLQARLQTANETLAKMKAELDQLVVQEPAWKERMAELRQQSQELTSQDGDLTQQLGQQQQELQELNRSEQRIHRQLSNLTDWRAVARNHLSSNKLGGEAIQVLDWVEQNRSRFRGEVRGPVLMELSIRDDFVAAVVDKVIPLGTQTAFVVQAQEDLTLLRDEFRGRRRFGVNFFKINNLAAPRRNVHIQQDGVSYLDDELGCHPVVKAQLTSFSNIHNIVLARGPESMVDARFLQNLVATANTGILYHQDTNSGHITNYSIRKSRYNSSGPPSTMKVEIPPARFKRQESNSDTERETLTRQLQQCQARAAQLQGGMADLNRRSAQIREEMKAIRAQMGSVQGSLQSVRTRQADVTRQERQIEELTQQLGRDFDKDADAQRQRVKQAVQQHLHALRNWKDAVASCAELMITAQSRGIEFSLVTSIFGRLNATLMELEETLTEHRRRMQAHKDRITTLEREIRRLTELLKGDMAPADDEEFTEIQELEVFGDTPRDQIEDARQRIENYTQQLRQTRDNNEVLERYARVQAELQETEAKLAELQGRLNHARGQMEERLQHFTDAVHTLAEKLNGEFAEFMEAMGAGGAIELVTSDGEGEFKVKRPIKDWEMQPQVRFRKGDTLSALSGMRNSGGERAVSTIMYLMALQDLSSAPVRIVDEINQGMDERNERLVFERIVSCTKNSQYFYISPKLLQALTAMEDDDVTVLLVLNGPGLRMRHQLPYYLKLLSGEATSGRARDDTETPARSKRARTLVIAQDDDDDDGGGGDSQQLNGRESLGNGVGRSPKRSLEDSSEDVKPFRRRV